jgi:hypothetical protein
MFLFKNIYDKINITLWKFHHLLYINFLIYIDLYTKHLLTKQKQLIKKQYRYTKKKIKKNLLFWVLWKKQNKRKAFSKWYSPLSVVKKARWTINIVVRI